MSGANNRTAAPVLERWSRSQPALLPVPGVGLEPTRRFRPEGLSLVRLPIPPSGLSPSLLAHSSGFSQHPKLSLAGWEIGLIEESLRRVTG
jgi:hypothetical protein